MKKKEMLIIFLTVIGLVALMYYTGMGCPILKLTGIPCFGCGMTRAVICLIHLDFIGAWQFHPLVYLMPFCITALLFVKRMPKRWIKGIVAAVVVLFVVTYMIRFFDPSDEIIKWQIENGIFYKMVRRIVQI